MTDTTEELSARDRRRRERSIWRTGLLVSVLCHLLIFFFWRFTVIPESPMAAAGPAAGDNRAARGSMQALNVRTPPANPIVPPPVPIPVDIAVEPVQFVEQVEIEPSSVAGDAPGSLDAPGLELGTGLGDGGNSDQGNDHLQQPVPRGLIIPPNNDALRGKQIRIWVFVDETGHVVQDSTRLETSTRNRDLDRQLIREAADWLFHPAQQAGKAVAAWFAYLISM